MNNTPIRAMSEDEVRELGAFLYEKIISTQQNPFVHRVDTAYELACKFNRKLCEILARTGEK